MGNSYYTGLFLLNETYARSDLPWLAEQMAFTIKKEDRKIPSPRVSKQSRFHVHVNGSIQVVADKHAHCGVINLHAPNHILLRHSCESIIQSMAPEH
jgi:hypothetical protein